MTYGVERTILSEVDMPTTWQSYFLVDGSVSCYHPLLAVFYVHFSCMYIIYTIYIYIYIYIVVYTREFSEDKVLNIVNVELWQLNLHLLPHVVTLCFTYADDDDDLQTSAEDHWVRFFKFRCRSDKRWRTHVTAS